MNSMPILKNKNLSPLGADSSPHSSPRKRAFLILGAGVVLLFIVVAIAALSKPDLEERVQERTVEFFSSDHVRLRGVLSWPSEDPEMLLVFAPGAEETSQQYAGLAQEFQQHGIAVLRFDYRWGSEVSSPPVAQWPLAELDLRSAVSLLKDKAPSLPLVVLGSRFGANLAIRIASETDIMDQIILLSPAPSIRGVDVSDDIVRVRQPMHWVVGTGETQHAPALALFNRSSPDEKTWIEVLSDAQGVQLFLDDPNLKNEIFNALDRAKPL